MTTTEALSEADYWDGVAREMFPQKFAKAMDGAHRSKKLSNLRKCAKVQIQLMTLRSEGKSCGNCKHFEERKHWMHFDRRMHCAFHSNVQGDVIARAEYLCTKHTESL